LNCNGLRDAQVPNKELITEVNNCTGHFFSKLSHLKSQKIGILTGSEQNPAMMTFRQIHIASNERLTTVII